MKYVFAMLLIYLSFISCEDCATPVECYAKAIEILKQDREEMRKNADQLAKSFDEKLEKRINEVSGQIDHYTKSCNEELNRGLNELRSEVNNMRNEHNGRMDSLDQRITGKRCYVATSKTGWGNCPYGGSYHGGWGGGRCAGINEENVWTGGEGFLCCN